MKTILRTILPLISALPIAASAVVFTSDTTLNPANTIYDGQDIVVSNCTLTVDGPHSFGNLLVAVGGTVTHTFSATGTVTPTNSVFDEPQVLVGTNDVTLANSNIVSASVVVKDLSGTVTYTNNLDYVVSQAAAQTFLRRSDTSSIPDGAMVLVSYNYTASSVAAGLNLTLASNLEVAVGGAINADGRGYGGNTGPGNGGEAGSPQSGAGAGYGGLGGNSSSNALGGATYGPYQSPTLLGSGGGQGVGGVGGSGGGLINLTVVGEAIINGLVSANGANATNSRSGGGSGGSIRITAQTFSGAGSVTAHGGNGEPIHGGGGGGGRIAINYSTNNHTGLLGAYGGFGWKTGGAGTVFVKLSTATGLLIVDNGGRSGTNTLLSVTSGDNVLVRSNASVLPSGNWSAGNVTVQAGAAITADGLGSPAGSGSGPGTYSPSDSINRPCSGGGHGGYGAMASTNVPGGNVYGTLAAPVSLGSGGGNFLPTSIGGNGGGAIRLTVNGTLTVDGRLSANGGNGSGGGGGGGSGGSIYLTVNTLAGAGEIAANGGNAPVLFGGGGGGGRIAIFTTTNLFTGQITTYGGTGANIAGAGTIYLVRGNFALITADNGGRAGTNTPIAVVNGSDVRVSGSAVVVASGTWTAGDVTIASNSFLSVLGPSSTLNLIAYQVAVEPGGGLIADGAGFPAASGTGFGGNYSGGGHGGGGGAGATNTVGGGTYGSQTAPTTFGSGGGHASNPTFPGGAGGGAIRLNVSGDVIVNGRVSANGRDSALGGGGAGGSIYVTASRLLGAGTIMANGGSCAGTIGGGGGGGRIAVVLSTNSFTGSLNARGGNGVNRGGAGTVYVEVLGIAGPDLRQLILDNGGGTAGTNTPLAAVTSTDLIVRNGAIAALSSSLTFPQLTVGSNGVVAFGAGSGSQLTITGNATIEPGGAVHADGLGFSINGIGAPIFVSSGIFYCGGGGHGGVGGQGGNTNARGGFAYGSVVTPTTTGSAGGGSFPSFGGAGGGAVRMTVTGSLTNNGRISSDGKIGSGTYPGGGSGGSVWLTLGSLYGSGLISANGGPGIMPGGGGGGGGRVSVSFNTNRLGGVISAFGGGGVNFGGAGTVYLRTNSASLGVVILDNNNNAGTNSALDTAAASYDLVIQGRAIAQWPISFVQLRHVLVGSNGVLQPDALTGLLNLAASGNFTIDAGGVVTADGNGYRAANGPGAGFSTSVGIRGGAGHGGFGGGNPSPGSSGAAYGSISSPQISGSGGGNLSPAPGGAGGGAIRLQVTGALTVNGKLSADGRDGSPNCGGGGGGSLWLTANSLLGSGIISANGGDGIGAAGGGAGGRISIGYTTSNAFSGSLTAFGGEGQVGGGAGTIYTKRNAAATGLLLIDNGGQAGTNTPLSSSYSLPTQPFDLTVGGSAAVLQLIPLPLLSNLTVGAGSALTMRTSETNIVLAVLRDASIAAGGAINVDGKGFASGTGTAPGASLASKGAGGGYGGAGGNSQSGALGGTNYGSATQPVHRGSGGGAGANAYFGGCEGGGAIRLSVGGTLNVDGDLTANGNAGVQDDSGGGAGGSVWVTAGAITGTGNILANGGDGELFGGGGGGGGRIAIYSPSNSFAGFTNAAGGIGANPGQAGTILASSVLDDFQVVSASPTGTVNTTVGAVDLNFNEVVAPVAVPPENFSLYGPNGLVPPADYVAVRIGLNGVRVSFPMQNQPGDYRLESGTAVTNLFGQTMQPHTNTFTIQVPTISGIVTNADGSPAAGVTLQASGGYPATATDASGHYVIGFDSGWTGTITPALGTNMFVPGTRSYTNVASDFAAENYLMLPTIAPTLNSGLNGTNLFFNWAGIPGVTYQAYSSTNLIDWLPLGDVIPGTNGLIELLVPVTDQPLEFLRVRATN